MADYPLHALRRLLRQPTPVRGVVVRLVGQTAQVATNAGLVTVTAGSTLRVGQSVRLRDGAAYATAAVTAVYPL